MHVLSLSLVGMENSVGDRRTPIVFRVGFAHTIADQALGTCLRLRVSQTIQGNQKMPSKKTLLTQNINKQFTTDYTREFKFSTLGLY